MQEKVIEYIEKGKTEKVFEILKSNSRYSINEVSHFESRWNRLKNEYYKGLISPSENRVEENKLIFGLIKFISDSVSPSSHLRKKYELIVFMIDNSPQRLLVNNQLEGINEHNYIAIRSFITRLKVDLKSHKFIISVCFYDDLNQFILMSPKFVKDADDNFVSPMVISENREKRNFGKALKRVQEIVEPYETDARISIISTLNGKCSDLNNSIKIANELKNKGYRLIMPISLDMTRENLYLTRLASEGYLFHVADNEKLRNFFEPEFN